METGKFPLNALAIIQFKLCGPFNFYQIKYLGAIEVQPLAFYV